MQTSPRQLREAAGITQMVICERSKKSLPTVRLYEANPEAVSKASRRALDAVYADLAPLPPVAASAA